MGRPLSSPLPLPPPRDREPPPGLPAVAPVGLAECFCKVPLLYLHLLPEGEVACEQDGEGGHRGQDEEERHEGDPKGEEDGVPGEPEDAGRDELRLRRLVDADPPGPPHPVLGEDDDGEGGYEERRPDG